MGNQKMYKNLTVCIPAYNEEFVIKQSLERLRSYIPDAEIIVVDDGSTDETAERARTVGGVRVISHERNQGYGAALKTAMRHATRSVIAWYDGDGQHNPEDLIRVVTPVLEGEADAVIGARTSNSDARPERKPGKWILQKIAEGIARRRIPDLNSGLRCFRSDVILRYLHLLPEGFSASSTSTLLLIKRLYRFKYVPITTTSRTGVSSVRMMRDGLRTIHLLLRMLVLFEAFRFFSLLSAFQLIVGFVYGLGIAIYSGLGFPVLAAVICISGATTFLMGLLCDQIVAIRMERLEVVADQSAISPSVSDKYQNKRKE